MATIQPVNIATLNRVLTNKGYAIVKTSLDSATLDIVRKELTVSPALPVKFSANTARFCIYQESPTRIYVPKFWGISRFGPPEADTISEGLCIPMAVQFAGDPFPHQKTIIQSFMENGANGLICIPCGKGKTVIAIYLAILLGKRFLVVVDKEFLMNQWKEEISKFVKNIRIGIVQCSDREVEVEKYDCTICMIQTLCSQEFKDGFFKDFGFAIFDECHHLGAQHFSLVLKKIHTKHMLGLSATPDRDDGLTKVFEAFLGKPVYQESREPDPDVNVRAFWFKDDNPDYTKIPTDWRGETVLARLMTQIVHHRPRTAKVVEKILGLVADPLRKILVLSERRDHLEEIRAAICGLCICGFYVGGMKQEELNENALKCKVLLGTYAMASEAMNIKALNSMVMASPRKRVEQSTGRILRVSPENRDVQPVIIDIIDQHEIYVHQWYQRQKYYKKCQYNITHEGAGDSKKGGSSGHASAELEQAIASRCMIVTGH